MSGEISIHVIPGDGDDVYSNYAVVVRVSNSYEPPGLTRKKLGVTIKRSIHHLVESRAVIKSAVDDAWAQWDNVIAAFDPADLSRA